MHICLQLQGALPPDLHRDSAPGPHWGTSVPQIPYLPPYSKFLATPLMAQITKSIKSKRIKIKMHANHDNKTYIR